MYGPPKLMICAFFCMLVFHETFAFPPASVVEEGPKGFFVKIEVGNTRSLLDPTEETINTISCPKLAAVHVELTDVLGEWSFETSDKLYQNGGISTTDTGATHRVQNSGPCQPGHECYHSQ